MGGLVKFDKFSFFKSIINSKSKEDMENGCKIWQTEARKKDLLKNSFDIAL